MEEGGERNEGTMADGAPRWDRASMGSAYCNIATATATRDSVVVSLGVSEPAGAEIKSELLHRILLGPRTAAHLHRILGTLLGEHETQRGEQR